MFLVLRPEDKAQATASAFIEAGIDINVCSVISVIHDDKQKQALTDQLNRRLISRIIVTSTYAANVLKQYVNTVSDEQKAWLRTLPVFAVGHSSASEIKHLFANVEIAFPQNSEGLLALTNLSSSIVKNSHIAIIKGHGGRDLIYTTLSSRDAIATEFCVYKRRILKQAIFCDVFVADEIECIIATSNEIVDAGLTLLQPLLNPSVLLAKSWIVASERIKTYLLELGATDIHVSSGASDQALIASAIEFKG